MIIQCEACKTKFRVGDDKVKPPGIKVRCSKCGEVFFFEYSLHEDHQEPAEQTPVQETESMDTEKADVSPLAPDLPEEPGISEAEEQAPEISFDEPESEIADTGIPESPEISPDPEISEENVKVAEPVQQEPNIEVTSAETENVEVSRDEESEMEVEQDSFLNLEIDPLDEPNKIETETQQEDFSPFAKEPETTAEQRSGSEFQSPNLSLDQDVLEQTYTKGTVATSAEMSQTQSSSSPKTVRRYPRRKGKGGGFINKFFGWVFAIILLGALFILSMFILNEMKIYSNDYFDRFSSFAKGFYAGDKQDDLKKLIRITKDKGNWQSSKYGQVYVVSGEIMNRSQAPINYVKLRVDYISDSSNVFIQELYAGNTLTAREIKNNSFNSIQSKLNRKNGDISYDAENLDGLNFDIQPGESIPFYSVFPAKEKILGLKYKVEVVSYDSTDVGENP